MTNTEIIHCGSLWMYIWNYYSVMFDYILFVFVYGGEVCVGWVGCCCCVCMFITTEWMCFFEINVLKNTTIKYHTPLLSCVRSQLMKDMNRNNPIWKRLFYWSAPMTQDTWCVASYPSADYGERRYRETTTVMTEGLKWWRSARTCSIPAADVLPQERSSAAAGHVTARRLGERSSSRQQTI